MVKCFSDSLLVNYVRQKYKLINLNLYLCNYQWQICYDFVVNSTHRGNGGY